MYSTHKTTSLIKDLNDKNLTLVYIGRKYDISYRNLTAFRIQNDSYINKDIRATPSLGYIPRLKTKKLQAQEYYIEDPAVITPVEEDPAVITPV